MHARQLMKFAMTGGAGMILDLSTLYLLTRVLHIPSEGVFFVSSFVGATFVFFINKYFTFNHHSGRLVQQLLKHYTVYGPAIIANFLLSNVLFLVLPDLAAKFIAIGVIAVWNYAMSHHYVFKKQKTEADSR